MVANRVRHELHLAEEREIVEERERENESGSLQVWSEAGLPPQCCESRLLEGF